MSTRTSWDTGGNWSRKGVSADGQQVLEGPGEKSSRAVRASCRDASSLKRSVSTSEDTFPKALPVLLQCVQGAERLPADDSVQEALRGRLRTLQTDNSQVTTLFMELSAHLVSIDSQENIFFVTFTTFEELWKFNTYHTMGFLGLCLENLLLEQKSWLGSMKEQVFVEVSLQKEILNKIYRGILMQEGSLFASCSTNQMFDSSTSGGDLYLEQGDIAQFEPPFLGSGWTVLCLSDGSRGTAPRPALEPVQPFQQWFLKSASEDILVGDRKPAYDFPLQLAGGVCEVMAEYDGEGPDELSVVAGERVIIMGLLAKCFDWFLGRKEVTGDVGLVRTSKVKPSEETFESADVFINGEDTAFFHHSLDQVLKESTALLRSRSGHDTGLDYKLDTVHQKYLDNTAVVSSCGPELQRSDLKGTLQRILNVCTDSESRLGTVNGTVKDSVLASKSVIWTLPCLKCHPIVEGNCSSEDFLPLFSFLDGSDFRGEFGVLYGLCSNLLASLVFTGHNDESELTSFLSAAREAARKKRLLWPQTRLCFLLGKLCAGRSKFSQARVYLEEALSVPRRAFTDLRLLASIYSSLSSIYLVQNNPECFFSVAEKLAALLFGVADCLPSIQEESTLKYILKKTLLSHNSGAEARACHLLAKHHWMVCEGAQVVPYLERLLVLGAEPQRTWSLSPSHGFLTLGRLYSELGLPHLSVSSARRASLHPAAALSDCLSSIQLALDNISKLSGATASLPAQLAPFIRRALTCCYKDLHLGPEQHRDLVHQLTVCLCQLLCKHGMVQHAICHMHTLISTGQLPASIPERNSALVWLAWLHINNQQPGAALEILDMLLDSLPEHCTTHQEGVVLNIRGVALRCLGNLRRAAENYEAAVDICQEYEDTANWAVAQANLGVLSLEAGAKGVAQRQLTEAVQLFSELPEGHEEKFISVLLQLGQLCVTQQLMHYGKGCYEWALVLAIKANLLACQLTATTHLIHLYGSQNPDQVQSLVYNQHLVHLLGQSGDRKKEGDSLEALSRLYLNLGTDRAYRAALDHTKSSLGIFIDLGLREKEAFGWLQAGKIYLLLGQTELVDLYLQAAQDVALSTGDTLFILKLLEAAGDIFFNCGQDREKAMVFFKDRALPIAVKSGCMVSRLRLCNKLTELLLALKMFEDAVEFAQTAMDISITLGDRLNERVACHRLALLYHSLRQYELAEHHFLKALSLCPSPLLFDEETLYYMRVYQTLGDIIFYNLKDPFDAAGYYHLALAAAMDLGNKRSQLQLCTRLATIYHNFLIDRELSLFFYQRARAFAAELNIRRVNISPDGNSAQIKTCVQ